MKDAKEKAKLELEELSESLDKENSQKLADLKAELEQKKANLEKEVKQNIEENQEKIRQVSLQKKDKFIIKIVNRVIDNYGS